LEAFIVGFFLGMAAWALVGELAVRYAAHRLAHPR
jgi:hypothetical protein